MTTVWTAAPNSQWPGSWSAPTVGAASASGNCAWQTCAARLTLASAPGQRQQKRPLPLLDARAALVAVGALSPLAAAGAAAGVAEAKAVLDSLTQQRCQLIFQHKI